MVGVPRLQLPSTSSKEDERAHLGMEGHREPNYGVKESEVAKPNNSPERKEMRCIVGLLNSNSFFEVSHELTNLMQDKVAYALSYMTRVAQNWAMPLLQALDEEREHELLVDYNAFSHCGVW